MRKSLLALSIAAMVGGLATGVANAEVIDNAASGVPAAAPTRAANMAITPTGVGHVLLVPYFTTQGTNKTLLNIVNTDNVNGKAVKLRYRGAANSDDVFDITIYLSPNDMWTANVSVDDAGFSHLVTNDNSCTLPSKADIKALNNGRFKTNRVQNNDAAQTREGYIEILNTADIPPTSPNTAAVPVMGANPLYAAILHNSSGMPPCTAAVMNAQANEIVDTNGGPKPANAYDVRGYSYPTGGLTANWTVVNVAGFASHSGEAVAIRAVTAAGGNGAANVAWFPQTTDTPIAGAISAGAFDVTRYTADPLLTSPTFITELANYDFPDLSTPYVTIAGGLPAAAATAALQANALSAAIATPAVINEYLTADGFHTDWVFSMPTRRYHVALNYAASGANRLLFRQVAGAGDVVPPAVLIGTNYYNQANTGLNAAGTQACVTPGNGTRGYDREEQTQTVFVISPDSAVKFCGETSVLAFNALGEPSVLNAQIARNDIKTNYKEGWMRVVTNAGVRGGVVGLPVIGYAAAKVDGANLGGTWKHRTGAGM